MPLLSRAAKKKTSWLRRKIYSWNPGKNCRRDRSLEDGLVLDLDPVVFQECDLAGSHLELPEAFVSTDLKFYIKGAYPALERS